MASPSRPLPLAAALLALLLGLGGTATALAAFGRKAKLKLRKAPEIQGNAVVPAPPATRSRRSLAPKPEQSAEADLNEELEALALQVLPGKEDQSKKAEIWKALQLICIDALGDGVEVWPFGSSANGCGEGGSDLDMVVSADEKPKRKAVNALLKIADECWMHGFEVEDFRPNAKVPILMLWKDGLDIDLSCGNLLPLLNTRLLRSYTLLNPRLSVVAAAVKRWAKAHGIAKTFDGFISSYAWTLMVVYYMQIKDQLPSLHRLMEWSQKDYQILNDYAWNFVSLEDAKQMWHINSAHMNSAELLRGFFSFYATDFVWGSEVVSVRRGEREMLSSRGCYQNLRGRTGAAAQLHIEDPIDIRRNLNFALKKYAINVNTIRFEIDSAHQLLRDGRGLTLLGIQLPPGQPGRLPWKQRVQEGFLELPGDPSKSVSTRCIYCNTSMPLAKFLDHGKCQVQRLRPGEACCEMCLKCFLRATDLQQHQEATGHQGLLSRDEALALAAAAAEEVPKGTRRRNLPRAKPKKRGRSAGLAG